MIATSGPSGYWRALRNLWARGDGFVLIEHDMVAAPEQIRQLWACPEPWCAHPYNIGGEPQVALGLAKFSTALLRAEPDALVRVGELDDPVVPAKDWRRLDERVKAELIARGYRVHVHPPAVGHLHSYG